MLYAFYYVFYYFNYDCVVRSYIFIIYFDEKMFFFLKNILYLSNGPTFLAIPIAESSCNENADDKCGQKVVKWTWNVSTFVYICVKCPRH